MANQKQYRVLTPDGLLSSETFVIPDQQPRPLKAGCVLVVHRPSGYMLTVHRTRLFPVDLSAAHQSRHACLKCGRVAGVIEDRVTCPEHGNAACWIVEPPEKPT